MQLAYYLICGIMLHQELRHLTKVFQFHVAHIGYTFIWNISYNVAYRPVDDRGLAGTSNIHPIYQVGHLLCCKL